MRIEIKRLLICVGLLVALPTVAAAAEWTIVDLGALQGARDNAATSINAAGEIVGSSGSSSDRKPVVFSNGVPQAIATSNGQFYEINNQGVGVGGIEDANGNPRAFSYHNGVVSDLGTFGGDRSTALGINNSGVIVGRARDAEGNTKAFVYQNGTMTPIANGTAMDVNNHGLVVGTQTLPVVSGFAYSNGNLQLIPGGNPWAVNDNGLIVGNGTGNTFADLYPAYYANGGWQSMGTLGGEVGIAFGVNNRDQAVGYSEIEKNSGPQRAFLYSNGTLQKLEDLLGPNSGWDYLSLAYDINDQGQIVGSGRKDGQWRAFLMTPTMDTFDLEVTYSNPLVLAGEGDGLPADVTARFVLEGIAGSPGLFRAEDVLSAYVEFADGVWTEVDLASFQMTLGPGGVNDILSLSYNFDTLITPSGAELSLRNNSFQLYVDGLLPGSGEAFSYFYPDSMQDLSVVPEPSAIVLAGMALVGVAMMRRRWGQQA